jgi:hypothetical protein
VRLPQSHRDGTRESGKQTRSIVSTHVSFKLDGAALMSKARPDRAAQSISQSRHAWERGRPAVGAPLRAGEGQRLRRRSPPASSRVTRQPRQRPSHADSPAAEVVPLDDASHAQNKRTSHAAMVLGMAQEACRAAGAAQEPCREGSWPPCRPRRESGPAQEARAESVLADGCGGRGQDVVASADAGVCHRPGTTRNAVHRAERSDE